MGLKDGLSDFLGWRKPPPVFTLCPKDAPPSPDAAGLVLAELRRDLERWIERAAEGSRTILALRQENARLLSECDAARREIEALRSSLEFRAASSAVGADELGSWSGLREGG